MKHRRRTVVKGIGGTLALSLLSHSAQARQDADSAKAAAPRIRIGQIGVGHAHAGKLSVYRSSSDYEVVGIVESNAELRKQAESQALYQDLPWMTQEQLLNVSGLQAVLVETQVQDLLNVAEICVAAGKHVHVDKPAGESLEQFTRILDSVAQQKLLLQMGYMYRYNPAVVMLRDFLKRGWLGDVFEVHSVMSKVVDPASRREHAKFSGGIMFELGGHIIDLVIGVLGKPTQVHAFPRRSGSHDDTLVDNMLAVFEYPQATATVKSSGIEVDGGNRRHLVVCGTEGTFHIQPLDNPSARVTLSRSRDAYPKGYQDISFPKYVRYVDDAADMAKILRGEKDADFSTGHDLTVQKVLLQASGMPN
ncbi:MAG: Gfo/Idh/MocA family oxidoreductase [Planctomycetota bacterium]|nr:Gfo/Idh/MocA family oxidoreductase [Planctomycetota bacterium]